MLDARFTVDDGDVLQTGVVKFDESKNTKRGEECIISADDSKVKVVVIPTDEELMIATDTMNLL